MNSLVYSSFKVNSDLNQNVSIEDCFYNTDELLSEILRTDACFTETGEYKEYVDMFYNDNILCQDNEGTSEFVSEETQCVSKPYTHMLDHNYTKSDFMEETAPSEVSIEENLISSKIDGAQANIQNSETILMEQNTPSEVSIEENVIFSKKVGAQANIQDSETILMKEITPSEVSTEENTILSKKAMAEANIQDPEKESRTSNPKPQLKVNDRHLKDGTCPTTPVATDHDVSEAMEIKSSKMWELHSPTCHGRCKSNVIYSSRNQILLEAQNKADDKSHKTIELDNIYKCKLCTRTFDTIRGRSMHTRYHLKCRTCGYSCFGYDVLSLHENLHIYDTFYNQYRFC